MANFLFVLSRDDNEAGTRCFQLAKIAHLKGHTTNLFLIDSGVNWANSERDLNKKTQTGDCPNDYLPYLVEKEVPIGVGIPCANARQVDEKKFFSNMMLDGGPHLIDLAAEAKVFNFGLHPNLVGHWNSCPIEAADWLNIIRGTTDEKYQFWEMLKRSMGAWMPVSRRQGSEYCRSERPSTGGSPQQISRVFRRNLCSRCAGPEDKTFDCAGASLAAGCEAGTHYCLAVARQLEATDAELKEAMAIAMTVGATKIRILQESALASLSKEGSLTQGNEKPKSPPEPETCSAGPTQSRSGGAVFR